MSRIEYETDINAQVKKYMNIILIQTISKKRGHVM
ncbi:hypothetical protein BH18THE2_BH18THE2_16190 [soil metagenome]